MRALIASLALSLCSSTALAAQVDAVTMMRLGLSPDSLAAAGVGSASVAGIVADTEESEADLAAADAAYKEAVHAAQALAKIVRKGNATAQQKADYQTAKATLASAEAARDAELDELFEDGTADLTSAQQDTLTQMRANMSRRGYATELLVVSRTDQQWIDLRHALEHEKVCTEDGEELHADVVTLLASVRSAAPVAAAKANLDANLASVKAAWDTALD